MNVGIRFVNEFGRDAAQAFFFKTVGADESVELFLRELVQNISGILLSQKSKKRSSPFLNLRRMSVDCHSIGNLSVAGDDGVCSAVHPYNAKATAAEGFHPLVVTDRWNLDFERAQGL